MIRPSTVGPQPTRGFAVPGGRRGPTGTPRRIHPRQDRVADFVQLGPLQLLQRGDIPNAEFREHLFGKLAGLIAVRGIAASARLRRGAMDQAGCGGHAEQGGHLRTAARLAVDHDAIGIAPKVGDVLPDPVQRGHQIRHADIRGVGIGRSADRGYIQKAETVEAVIDRDGHHVVMPGHLRSILGRELIGRAKREAAAVDVDHHGTFARQAGGPDVDLEHVFALPAIGPLLEKRLFARPIVQALRAVAAVGQRRQFALPRRGRFRGQPAVLAARVRPEGNAFECEDAILNIAAHLAILRARDRRPRRGAASARTAGGRAVAVRGAEGAGEGRAETCRGGEKQRLAPGEPGAVGIIRMGHAIFFPCSIGKAIRKEAIRKGSERGEPA